MEVVDRRSARSLPRTGPSGALWFTEASGNRIGRITTSGTITEYPIPTASSYPEGIAPGPDSALWFTEHLGKTLVRSPARGPGLSFRIDVAVAQRETGHAARMGGEG